MSVKKKKVWSWKTCFKVLATHWSRWTLNIIMRRYSTRVHLQVKPCRSLCVCVCTHRWSTCRLYNCNNAFVFFEHLHIDRSVFNPLHQERQLQLIRDLLISERGGSSVHLSEEQRAALAFLSAHSQAAQAAQGNLNASRRSDPGEMLIMSAAPRRLKSVMRCLPLTVPRGSGRTLYYINSTRRHFHYYIMTTHNLNVSI